MTRRLTAILLLLALATAAELYAQTGAGSLRGYVRDESGAVLPGVTVTAESEALMGPQTAVTDGNGYYRILNLPPGDYVLTFEMPGFATYRQEGIVLRAAANFGVDATLKISAVQETITVTAETPMLEIAKPSNVLNVEGEFQRDMPIQARRNWSDFLELTPGVNARPFDDGSGRMVYFGHATEHFAHVIQLEGMIASGYRDPQVTYVGMGADLIEDVQIKTGGVDAAAPMGTGLVINVVTKSGGNNFSGSVGYALQDLSWNGDNVPKAGKNVGTPTSQQINQLDVGFGGPIMRDKAWFFTSFRNADLENGISRTGRELQLLKDFRSGFEPFNNTTTSRQPYLKITSQLNPNHELNGYYQYDRLHGSGDREYMADHLEAYATGGSLLGGKLTSVWSSNLTSQITASWNNKASTYADPQADIGTGPLMRIHREAFLSGGELVGTGRLIDYSNRDEANDVTSQVLLIRADVTYFKEGWGGSHEFQTGTFIAPRYRRHDSVQYTNGGFNFEEQRLVDPEDISKGTIPFHRQIRSPDTLERVDARDRDIGIYFQDSWKPHERLTLNLGVRADFVKRHDAIFNIDRMNSVEVAPRLGFSYLVTADARNVLRGSLVRVHEQVGGRDYITSYGGGSQASTLDQYDLNGDGVFETEFFDPAVTATLAPYKIDDDISQPYTDEYILGFRKQFPGQFALDVAGIHRRVKHRYAEVDVNGIYPDGPGKPFIGFGKVDPARGKLKQITNNTWDQLVYTAIEITATQRLGGTFQFVAGINRQWQHFSGTWNPTDPAGFIQPGAYPSSKLIYMPRGLRDDNSYQLGTNSTYGPTWRKYSVRFGATWNAPAGIVVAANYSQLAGPWSGPILIKISKNDPDVLRFGPAKVPVEGGFQSNPLASTVRFKYATRGEGQVQAPPIKTLGIKIGKKFPLGGTREAEVAANIFNLFNFSDFNQYTYNGANQEFNPNFLQMRSLEPPRALQLTFRFRF